MMNYTDIRSINVNTHIEKKNGLSYLSWAWAVDQLLLLDSDASWEYGEPRRFGETLMVFCTVTAFGKRRTAQFVPVAGRMKLATLFCGVFYSRSHLLGNRGIKDAWNNEVSI